MKWTIPGTEVQINREDAGRIEEIFSSMFLAGGMALGQVASITGLEPYTVQNWVKRGFLSPPENRHYSLNQLCRIIHINMLKSVLSMETICGLLEYINGKLDEENDDIIDDAALYFLFVKLAARAKQMEDASVWERELAMLLADYKEPVPGARERIEKALRIMVTAWIAARTRQAAEKLIQELV